MTKLSEEELDLIVEKLEEKILERLQINIGKAVLTVVWKSVVTFALGFAAWFHFNPKGH